MSLTGNNYVISGNLRWRISLAKLDLQITPHRFRHTHCSLLFEIGASIKETGDRVAKFMGMELKCTQKRIQNNFRQKEKAQNADLTTF